ncbi:unnamed protein product [Knipowitschia caucasica]|uniref:Uncharacterized protein n=1 Tax=Knipowitschia caucasica TaxID=637954 RepID=A0AAV2LH88_KNICA
MKPGKLFLLVIFCLIQSPSVRSDRHHRSDSSSEEVRLKFHQYSSSESSSHEGFLSFWQLWPLLWPSLILPTTTTTTATTAPTTTPAQTTTTGRGDSG